MFHGNGEVNVLVFALLYEALPVVAVAAVLTVFAVPAWRERIPGPPRLEPSARPDTAVRWTVAAGAVGLLLLAVTETVMRFARVRIGAEQFLWWRYSLPLLAACLILLILAVLLAGFRRRTAEPVAPTRIRTWRSFNSTYQLLLLGGSAFALILFVAFAGSASSPDDDGRYRELVIDTGGTGGLVAGFFGWAYGLPAAAAALVLLALAVWTLHLNAARPFLAPETVEREEASRSALSFMVLSLSAGAVLLTLARALDLSSGAAGVSLEAEGYSFETALAAAAPWLSGLSYLVKFFACLLLVMVVAAACRRPQLQAAGVHG